MTNISFENFTESLIFDNIISKPINEETNSMTFPPIKTKAKSEFVKYFLSASHYFKQYLVISKSDELVNAYLFKCSVNECPMKLKFHQMKGSNNLICLDKGRSEFKHDENCHKLYPHSFRMLEETYKQ